MGNEIINAYCQATGKQVDEILNRKRDKQSLTVRNALLVITWRKKKHRINRKYKKLHLLIEIGQEFGMSRINVHEQIDTFEANLAVNRELQEKFEEIQSKI